MKCVLSFLLFQALVLFGCTQKQPQYEVITLTEENLPQIIPLKLEKIDLPEDYLMGNTYCYVYKDTILLVLKKDDPYPLTHMLTIINMNTQEKIGEYFTRGQGPREFISLTGFLSHNHLDLCCYTTRKLVSFNIDSAIMLGNKYQTNVVAAKWEGFLDFRKFDDSSFLVTNMFYFDGCKEYKTDASVPEFYKISNNGDFSPAPKKINFEKLKCFPANVNGCEMSINEERKRVVCCYHYQPYIKVFDLNMKQIRQINGPEPDDGEYAIEYDNMLFFSVDKGINHYYYQSFCDDDYIYVANRRNHGDKSRGAEFIEKEKNTTEIFQLDWDGNVTARYSAKGYEFIYMTYGAATNIFYVWVDDNGERALYKAKLD